MSVETCERAATTNNPTRMVHIENPVAKGTPLCGASVLGEYPARTLPVDCVVCSEIWAGFFR